MITAAPWYTELLALAAAVVALGVLGRVARHLLQAFWAAIVAAPLIVAGLDELVQLIRGDVLGRLDDGTRHFADHDHRIEKVELAVLDHEERIVSLEHPKA